MATAKRWHFVELSLSLVLVACGETPTQINVKNLRTTANHDVDQDAGIALQASETPPEPVRIVAITNSGSGCPEGSIGADLAPDGRAFTAVLSQFSVALDPQKKSQTSTSRCQVDLAVALPRGWQMSVLSINQRGFADLPKGARATLQTEISLANRRGGKTVRTKLYGPLSNDFQSDKTVAVRGGRWSRCGGETSISIDQRLTVRVKREQGALTAVDSLDGELSQDLAVGWRRCECQ